MLSQFLRQNFPQLAVLSNLEIADNREIKMSTQIGAE
jgi:flagellar biosynthesis protein FlhA